MSDFNEGLRGEIAARLDTLDAHSSPLGAKTGWTIALRNVVDLISAARAQIVLFWGPQYIALYNADYAPSIGDKHPRGARETGEPFFAKDRPFYIERHQGIGETVYFDISYSPVRDDDGSIGGVM